jgi:hypothetical protein
MAKKAEMRQSPRKPLWYPAKIDCGDGSAIRDCQLRDISVTGARIKIEKLNDLPSEFVLLLANIGKPHRRCHVVWQTATEAGVQFLLEDAIAESNYAGVRESA